MALKKVRPGDPLSISASTFNSMVDATQDYLDRQRNTLTGQVDAIHRSGICLVKNDSGNKCERFGILGIDAVAITKENNEAEFKNAVTFVGKTPDEDTHFGKFVIMLEPCENGKYALGMKMGMTPVQINIVDEDHGYADVNDGSSTYLKSGHAGSAQILWKEEGTGYKWAVVCFGASNFGTHVTPKELTGTGDTANTDTWKIDEQEDGYDGVTVTWHRTYFSGTAGDPVYLFTRTGTYDSTGRLVEVSAETRLTLAGTGPC